MSNKRTPHPKRSNLLFVVLAVLLALGAAEVVLRLVERFGSGPEQFYSDIYDVEYVMSQDARNPYGEQHDPMNAWGLRGPDFPRAKPQGELRLVCLGDSTTYGFTSLEDSFPGILQRLLDQRDGPGRWRVINAGIPGTGFFQQLLFFNKTLLPASPDWVVVFSGPNYWPAVKTYRDRMESRIYRSTRPLQLVLRRLALYRGLRRLIKGGVSPEILDDSQIEDNPELQYDSAEYKADYRRDLEAFGRLAIEHGFRPIFMRIPDEHNIPQVLEQGVEPGDEWFEQACDKVHSETVTKRFALEQGHPWLDMYADFIERRDAPGLYADDTHPDALGNEMIARRLLELIPKPD
ncbi:MAG: SGNH/GDSL hydrolase family protein [Candidatus Alcyoniella australis]|nr:SGNH/GDSL hydrolase family protein [Candidatus Alcyoniella australis]